MFPQSRYDALEEFEEVLNDILEYNQTNGSLIGYMNQNVLSSYTDEEGNRLDLQVYVNSTGPSEIIMQLIYENFDYPFETEDKTEEIEIDIKTVMMMQYSINLSYQLKPLIWRHK